MDEPAVPRPTDAELAAAAGALAAGELVAFATETVYGLGAVVWDERAVARVFALKGRPRFDPLIVHVEGAAGLGELAAPFPSAKQRLVDRLTERFWPGPLTLVLPKRSRVPDLVTAGLGNVAVRAPAHPVAQRLLRAIGAPLAAPSANRFGRVSPTTAAHVRESFGADAPLVLDGGPCLVGVESTVLSLVGDEPAVLRPGGVSVEELETVIGPVRRAWTDGASSKEEAAPAPGMLASHYAPSTPLTLVAGWCDGDAAPEPPSPRSGLLCLRRPPGAERYAAVEELTPTGDLAEAAARLFAAMRRLDAAGLDAIVALPAPAEGLGAAIADRLRRAAAR